MSTTGDRPRNLTIGSRFSSGRVNGLNLVRLLLAVTVVISHSWALGGYGNEEFFQWSTAGTLAVYGFFGISGYLIAASADRYKTATFLWHRFLRIFPAFWVCLLVTAFLFGLLAWDHADHACGGFACYVRQPGGPLGYVFHNLWLRINQSGITGTLHRRIYAGIWNGSLWTLFYEFICYLVVGGLALVGVLRRPKLLIGIAGCIWALEIIVAVSPNLNAQVNGFHRTDYFKLLALVPVFLVGSLIYVYRNRIPDSAWIAVGCIGALLVTLPLPLANGIPGYTLTRADIAAPLIAFPVLWLGAHLPWPPVAARNDYSYGVYIYAFPIAQLLAIWGAAAWGFIPYTFLTLAMLAPFAVASWLLIERHALRLRWVHLGSFGGRQRPTGGGAQRHAETERTRRATGSSSGYKDRTTP